MKVVKHSAHYLLSKLKMMFKVLKTTDYHFLGELCLNTHCANNTRYNKTDSRQIKIQ